MIMNNFTMNINMNMNNTNYQKNLNTIRRRVFTKTQLSASKRQYNNFHLTNNFNSRQNTFGTIDSSERNRQNSQNSLRRYEKVRSYSNKSLFHKARLTDSKKNLYNMHKKKVDNFIIPDKKTEKGENIDTQGKKKKKISSLLDQMINKKKPQLKIQKVNEESIQSTKTNINEKLIASKRKIEQILNMKLQSRKQNLEKSQRLMTELIENATQTDQVQTQVVYTEDNEKKPKQIKKSLKPQNAINENKKKQKQIKQVKKTTTEQIPIKQTTKERPKENSFFDEVEDLTQIRLNEPVENKPKKQKQQQKPVAQVHELKPEKVSEKRTKTQGQEKKAKMHSQLSEKYSEQLQNIVLNPHSRITDEMEQNAEKEKVKKQLERARQVIDLVTPLGQIAGYCSYTLKKSKLNWIQPSILFYRQCYSIFIMYEELYRHATKLKLLQEEQLQRFVLQNQQIKTNLQKLLNSGKKKGKIDEQYFRFLQPSCQVDLTKYLNQETSKFAHQVLIQEQENDSCLVSALRMINGVLILASLKGKRVQLANLQEQMTTQQLKQLLKQKVKVASSL